MFEMLGLFVSVVATIFVLCVLSSRFRIVVPTSAVHIVQHAAKTTTYGKDQPNGNVYYHWPAWIPRVGVRSTQLPTSVFPLRLTDYPAYDKGRLPFVLDVIGFFRITDFSSASSRITDMKDLVEQLDGILKGAMRSILASSEIEEILEGRREFGVRFTQEVDEQLTQWGVTTVKSIELMDIRDTEGSKVISNIMAKKKSLIEMQSRVEVAGNMQAAQVAEINAKQTIDIRSAEQQEMVGRRAAERDQAVGIRQQQAEQAVKIEEAKTAQTDMEVTRVRTVMQAEIARESQLVATDQARQITIIDAEAAQKRRIIDAEATKQNTILLAEGELESQKMAAEARRLTGLAEGEAQQAVLMAPVTAQIALAEKISKDESYQHYLITLEQIKSGQAVGMEAAAALGHAEIKVISTTGNPMEGLKSAMDLLTPQGATQLGTALEALRNTPVGKQIMAKLVNGSGHAAGA